MIKITPIILQPALAQSVAERIKTITRRSVGLAEVNKNPNKWTYTGMENVELNRYLHIFINKKTGKELRIFCGYGQFNDLLYVRESWFFANGEIGYVGQLNAKPETYLFAPGEADKLRKKPGIHLKRKDSRTWLRICSIRPERVQQITKADAIAEGIERITPAFAASFVYRDYSREIIPGKSFPMFLNPVQSFRSLWVKIHKGPASWKKNIWVWRIEFEKLEANEIPH